MIEETGATDVDPAVAQGGLTDPALPDAMPTLEDAILGRIADLEEHVGYLEAALLRLREEVRLGDACAARFLGYVAAQAGIEMTLALGPEIGPPSKALRRFKAALDIGADPASAALLVAPRSVGRAQPDDPAGPAYRPHSSPAARKADGDRSSCVG